MRVLISVILFAPCLLADEAGDRKSIESIVAMLNKHPVQPDDVLTPEAKQAGEVDRLFELDRLLSSPRPPWSETTIPSLVIRSVQFVTPDTAVVDADVSQYGSLRFLRVPVVFVFRKDSDWRIAAIRFFNRSPLWLVRIGVMAEQAAVDLRPELFQNIRGHVDSELNPEP